MPKRVIVAIAAVAVCSCGATASRGRQASVGTGHAPSPRGVVAGTVENDGCPGHPCPNARPPLPIVARVTARAMTPSHSRATVATTSDRQGRFRLRLRPEAYEISARPVSGHDRCRRPRVHVYPRRDTRVLVSCG